MKKYQVIYADPPWQFKNYNDKTARKWVGQQYELMNIKDISQLPIQEISDKNCALFMWAVYPSLPKAFEIIKSWGFQYKTVAFTWVKKNKIKDSWFWGMGYWTRSNAEICLLATKGHPQKISSSVHSIIDTPIEGHSKKPDEVRKRIVEIFGDLPRIELFAREKTEGWDVWGNEVESDIAL